MSTLQYAARTELAGYLRSVGEVLTAENTRADSMHKRARASVGRLGTVGERDAARSSGSPRGSCL